MVTQILDLTLFLYVCILYCLSSIHIYCYDNLRQHIKNQRHYFANEGPYSQRHGFSSGRVWMWELDHKEGRELKNWCFWTLMWGNPLVSFLDCKEIKQVNPKGNQSWISIGRTDAEAKASILWPPVAKSWLIRKEPNAGQDWRQEERGTTEDEMAGWHHRLNGHEFEWVMDREAWRAAVHGVTKNRTRLSDWRTTTWHRTKIMSCSRIL